MSRLPLFVYGTLMSGEAQGPLLGSSARRAASVRGTLFALPAGYPALVAGGTGRVHGELVDPPDERMLQLLDTYEGVPEGLFARVEVDARVGLRTVRAWAYTMDVARARTGTLVRSGRWQALRRR